jgi:sorting and assembly machinery component 37
MLASNPESKASIRLDALARDFLKPLKALKGKKRFLVSDDQFTSLDCLALGYLSLMLVDDLPSPWLAKTLKEKFPSLAAWTEELRESIFGATTTLEDAFLKEPEGSGKEGQQLPWVSPQNRGVGGVGSAFAAGFADSMPVLGAMRRNQKAQHYQLTSKDADSGSSTWHNITLFGSLLAGIGLAAGYLLHQGILAMPSREEESKRSGFRDYGEAGTAMSVLLAPTNRTQQVEQNYAHGEPVVEVDVDLKEGNVKTTEAVI